MCRLRGSVIIFSSGDTHRPGAHERMQPEAGGLVSGPEAAPELGTGLVGSAA